MGIRFDRDQPLTPDSLTSIAYVMNIAFDGIGRQTSCFDHFLAGVGSRQLQLELPEGMFAYIALAPN